MSVEQVDLIQVGVVETLVWEVLLVALHFERHSLPVDAPFFDVVHKVVVHVREVMVECYEHQGV